MKRILITTFVFAAFLSSCNQENSNNQNGKDSTESKPAITSDIVNNPATASGNADNSSLPVITFEKESHDFGKITQGEKVSYAFKFKNTGGSDLVISTAYGSCGCTVPNYPKTPVAPGAEGLIDVVFNSEGKAGKVQKTVTIVANAVPNSKVITISTEIVVPEDK